MLVHTSLHSSRVRRPTLKTCLASFVSYYKGGPVVMINVTVQYVKVMYLLVAVIMMSCDVDRSGENIVHII